MNRARRAITLIEMLVAVLIIAVVTALTLPAIQSARESARAAMCRNNLRQVALAANQYESIFLRYPPAVVASGYSAHTAILPYLEMTSIYQSINFSVRQVMLS
jgi:prepilin-type N-terminal cleavage/methylation domain-containing protein